jgi:hypothetical protein
MPLSPVAASDEPVGSWPLAVGPAGGGIADGAAPGNSLGKRSWDCNGCGEGAGTGAASRACAACRSAIVIGAAAGAGKDVAVTAGSEPPLAVDAGLDPARDLAIAASRDAKNTAAPPTAPARTITKASFHILRSMAPQL